MNTAATQPAIQDRQIRVFISSTFRDMQKERELLVKNIFPELRRLCDERFVSFTEIDLRWGITEEQQAEGKVLPICLEEIHTCRPYFIGLLGERYGWIPNTVPPEVLAKEAWIQEHICQRTSVTELEILHGVLNNPKLAGHAFFYFRDPAYIAKLPPAEQVEMVERDIPDDIKEFGPEEAARRTQHRKDRLAALKETIRQSHLPLVDSYAAPEALAASIRQQFLDLIDKLYPKAKVPDRLDQEAIGHRTYARRKLLACIERPTHLAALDAFVTAPPDGRGMLVTGDSGGGKTALLAQWGSSHSAANCGDFFMEHYFGATSDSASVPKFLCRLLGELKRLANIPDEIPSAPEKMAEALPLWLAQSVGKVPRIILVVDALDQIEGQPSDCNLSWLPRFFPAHVRVIASSLAGPAFEALRDRSWIEHPLSLPDVDERGRMIDKFLGIYRKELSPNLRNKLVYAPGAANPLFLRTVLDELRQFGDFDHLPDKVLEYLQATTPVELFRKVIRRWQADFHADRDVVSRSLRHLWAARQGLSESEWLDLLTDVQGPMDRQIWRPLFLALATQLVQRSGLWVLGHDYLKQAIQAELIPTEGARNHAHLAVADYFEKHTSQQGMTPRKAAEWPHQLHAAQAWDRLEGCLTNIPLFLSLYNDKTKWNLVSYWQPLCHLGYSMGDCYSTAYESWIPDESITKDALVCASMGQFLSENGFYSVAEQFLKRALQIREQALGVEHPDTLASVNELGELMFLKGNYIGAESWFKRALKESEQLIPPDHHITLVIANNLGMLFKGKGDYSSAETWFRRSLETSERFLGLESPKTLMCLNNLAGLLESKGALEEAEHLYRRVFETRDRVCGRDHPDTLVSVNNLAVLLYHKNDYAGAEPLYWRAIQTREWVLGAEHPDTLGSMNNLAALLYRKGNYAGAETWFRRALLGLLRISMTNECSHFDLQGFINNYGECLEKQGVETERIRNALDLMMRPYGFSLDEVDTHTSLRN